MLDFSFLILAYTRNVNFWKILSQQPLGLKIKKKKIKKKINLAALGHIDLCCVTWDLSQIDSLASARGLQ